MKTLLVATFVDFWTGGSGHRSRISQLIGFLQDKVSITVFFAGAVSEAARETVRQRFPQIGLEGAGDAMTYRDYSLRFSHFIRDRFYDFVLVEYIELSGILEYLPEHTVTLLDTHDLVADRIRSFRVMGVPYDGVDLSPEDELDIFRCYDHVLFIQQNELESVARDIHRDRLVLAPHAVAASPSPMRESVRQIGFVASPYPPNVEALDWFLCQIWGPLRRQHSVTLNVYGNIREAFAATAGITAGAGGVRFHGFVEDLKQAYRECDLVINPVRCGAGLKIKNVEALAHGLPLVTTTHGASGLEDAAGSCFLPADDPPAFLSAMDRLIRDAGLRQALGRNAIEYARTHFSAEKCYGPLASIIL
ncbi:MAG TPA: glycosyltransferase family 4 protein [Puia sp.]|uniref:glycosyltransferase family 4 protein n=1 Tax=Puia sp. TaxID=2045100 RepID=UPI002B679B63|nr:glycosyltransferase family 4 protein [Puia sp.]HVU98017.1 glycosyltransferase family 4 protein [Puia sp.]